MTKKIILLTASALILLVLYWLYSLQSEPLTVTGREVPAPLTSLPADVQADTRPTARITRAGVPIGVSERVFFEWFTEDGRKSGEWRAERASPAGPNQFELDRPEAVLYARGGQIIRVLSDKGHMVVDEADGRLDPKRGRLWDHVVLTIDRSTDAWRQQHPLLASTDKHPHLLVRIELDDLGFDRDLGKVWTDGPVTVASDQFGLVGEGLLVTWNELIGRLDWLRVTRGHRLTYRTQRGLLAAEAEPVPGAIVNQQQVPGMGEGFAFADPAQLSSWSSLPTYVMDPVVATPEPAPGDGESAPTYRATFAGPVAVRSEGPDRSPAELIAQELAVTFDFTREGDSQRTGESPDDLDLTAGVEGASTIEVAWDGPLEVQPIQAPANRTDRDRLFVVARGEPVRLEDERGHMVAETLVYDESGGRLWLLGSPTTGPVSLADETSRTLSGQDVFVDQLLGWVRINGAGQMRDTSVAVRSPAADQEAGMGVAWQEGAELHLAPRPAGQEQPASAANLLGGRYVSRGIFRGQVEMRQAEQGLKAQAVEVRLGPPAEGEGDLARPTELVAVNDVRLDFGPQEEIACDRLRAEFASDASGQAYPRLAHAVGDVLARQETRTLSAGRMRVALDRVLDAEGRPDLAVVAADAYEQVLVEDPVEPIHIIAEHVHCTLPDGRKLEQVHVAGGEQQLAEVYVGQRAIRGRQVDLDLAAGTGGVPGPGWLRFVSDRDLEGRRQAEPVPVEIDWSQQMELSGGENILTFAGDVTARSRTNRLRCDRLRVEFVDEPAIAGAKAPEPLWILDRPARRVLAKQPERRDQVVTVTVDKRPVYLRAEGDVVLVSEEYASADVAAGRVLERRRIDGPAVAVDLAEEWFHVIGSGHLLAEDYRQPTAERRPRPVQAAQTGWTGRVEPRDPLLEDLTRRGPNQTLFTWGSSMSYSAASGLAIFDEQVRMKHLWGSKMVLADALMDRQPADWQQVGEQAGGEAGLVCDHLLVGIGSQQGDGAEPGGWGLGSGQLDRLVATGRVHLQEGSLSLEGTRLAYWGQSNLVELEGSTQMQATLYDAQEGGTYRSVRAPWMRWYRHSGRIEAAEAVISQSGP